MEPGVWTPEKTLGDEGIVPGFRLAAGALLRNLGFAARFVSGYLIQLVADVKPLDGPAGPTADFTDLHAWAEVYLPGAGWIGLDRDLGADGGRRAYSAGRHARSASRPRRSPAWSSRARPSSSFDMRWRASRETPRVTKPYTEAQWQDILARVPRWIARWPRAMCD